MNKVILIGNLGKDPEVRYTPDGTAVANFSIATSEKWKDKDSGEKREKTEWHNIVAWRRLGEVCGEYLHKGSKVAVEGKMQTRSWEDKDKNTRYKTEVVITEMEMLPSKSDQGGNYGDPPPERGSDAPQHGTAPGAGAAPGAKTYPGQDGSDPDIPF